MGEQTEVHAILNLIFFGRPVSAGLPSRPWQTGRA